MVLLDLDFHLFYLILARESINKSFEGSLESVISYNGNYIN